MNLPTNRQASRRVQAKSMRTSARSLTRRSASLAAALPCLLLALAQPHASAQTASDPAALRWVKSAVESELYSDAHDIPWAYRDHDIQPGHDAVMEVVDTPNGGLHRIVSLNGTPLTGKARQAETDRINDYVNDPSAQAKKRRDEAKDDRQAAALLRMWTEAFIVTIASETPKFITLDYKPNPAFDASSIEARVMSQMQGQLVITREGTQIYSVHGRLMQDIHVAFGFVKLKAGGTFDVERREIKPGHWQVIEQHTHIQGHALLFKSISQEEDDTKTNFHPSPAHTLAEAATILNTEH